MLIVKRPLRFLLIFFSLLLINVATPDTGECRSLANGSVSFMFGILKPKGSNAGFAYEAAFHYRIKGRKWRLGGFLRKYGVGVTAESNGDLVNASQSELLFGAEGMHYFSGPLEGFSGGLKMGFSSVKISASANSGSTSVEIEDSSVSFFFGPKLGYDYAIGRFSFGAELSYILSIGAGRNAFAIMAPVKFWF